MFAVALLASGQNSTLTGTLAGQIVLEGFTEFRIPAWLRRMISRLLAIVPSIFVVAWYGDRGPSRGRVHVPRLKTPVKGTAVRWRRPARPAPGQVGEQRPPGRLRRIGPPELSRLQLLYAPRLYDLFDPDGTPGRADGVEDVVPR